VKKLAAPSNSPSLSPSQTLADDTRFKTRRYGWPIADGYLGSQVIAGFWRGLTWFVGLFLAFVLISGAQKVAQQKMSLSLIFLFILLQLPRIVVFTIPASLLFGSVSSFTELSSRGEVTALMAGGMSLRRMLRAPFLASVALAILAFWLQESIVPQCELKRGELAISSLQNAGGNSIFPKVEKDTEGNVKYEIRAGNFDTRTLEITKPYVWLNHPDGSSVQIKAASAHWDKAQKAWVFVDCTTRFLPSLITPKNGPMENPPTFQFDKQTFPDVTLDPNTLGRTTRNEQDAFEQHNYEMISIARLKRYRSDEQQKLRAEQSAAKPNQGTVDKLQSEIRASTFGIHDKFSVPLIVLTMVLVGAPLGIRPQRTASAGLALGLSLMVLLGYYIVWTTVSTWGKSGGEQPLVAAYLPFAILFGLGAILTWKKN